MLGVLVCLRNILDSVNRLTLSAFRSATGVAARADWIRECSYSPEACERR